MSKEEIERSTITNFIMKVCSLERYIEIKRQMLCDKDDFEPYVAFQRLARNGQNGVSSSNIMQFLSENLVDMSLAKCRLILNHYDADKDGVLSYKEFLELVLPKEHPELRAFVTQRECFDIKQEEYLSYETEAAMAILLGLEIDLFDSARNQKEELDKLELDGHKIVEIIDGNSEGNLNFNNIQDYLNDSGIMAYDSEIINFLRRVDRDDDGVILGEEFVKFLCKFDRENLTPKKGDNYVMDLNKSKLECFSPGRKIVTNRVSMIAEVKEKKRQGPETRRQKKIREDDKKKVVIRRVSRTPRKVDTTPNKLPQEQEEIKKSIIIQDTEIKKEIPKEKVIVKQTTAPQTPTPIHIQVTKSPAVQPQLQKTPTVNENVNSFQKTTQKVVIKQSPNPIPQQQIVTSKEPKRVQVQVSMKSPSYQRYSTKGNADSNKNVKMKYDTFGQNRVIREDPNVLQEMSSNAAFIRSKAVESKGEQNRTFAIVKNHQNENIRKVTKVEDYNKKVNYGESNHVHEDKENARNNQQQENIIVASGNCNLESKRGNENEISDLRGTLENPPQTNRSQLALNRSRERLRRSKYLKGSKHFETGGLTQSNTQNYPVTPQTRNQVPQSPIQGNNDQSPIHHSKNPNQDHNIHNSSIDRERNFYPNQHQTSKEAFRRDTIPTNTGNNHQQYVGFNQMNMTSSQISHINDNSLDHSQISIKTKKSKRKRLNHSKSRKSKSPLHRKKRRDATKSPTMRKKKRLNKVFFNYLADLIFDERSLEECRKQLVSSSDFSLNSVFNMIDKKQIGRFTFEDFRSFLCDIGVSYTDTRSLTDLYACLNSNQSCLLEIEDLASMIAPRDPNYQKYLEQDNDVTTTTIQNQNTVNILSECFNKLFASRKLLMEAKLAFKEDNIDFHEAFEEIDITRKGWVGRDDFKKYLRRRLPDFQESGNNEISHFIENCDFDQDGKVCFKDFYMFFAS